MKPRLFDKYVEEIRPQLMKDGKFSNVHQVPAINKIVINMGVSGMVEKVRLKTPLQT